MVRLQFNQVLQSPDVSSDWSQEANRPPDHENSDSGDPTSAYLLAREGNISEAAKATFGFGSKEGSVKRFVPLENSYPTPAWEGWRPKKDDGMGMVISILVAMVTYFWILQTAFPNSELVFFAAGVFLMGYLWFRGDV